MVNTTLSLVSTVYIIPILLFVLLPDIQLIQAIICLLLHSLARSSLSPIHLTCLSLANTSSHTAHSLDHIRSYSSSAYVRVFSGLIYLSLFALSLTVLKPSIYTFSPNDAASSGRHKTTARAKTQPWSEVDFYEPFILPSSTGSAER